MEVEDKSLNTYFITSMLMLINKDIWRQVQVRQYTDEVHNTPTAKQQTSIHTQKNDPVSTENYKEKD